MSRKNHQIMDGKLLQTDKTYVHLKLNRERAGITKRFIKAIGFARFPIAFIRYSFLQNYIIV